MESIRVAGRHGVGLNRLQASVVGVAGSRGVDSFPARRDGGRLHRMPCCPCAGAAAPARAGSAWLGAGEGGIVAGRRGEAARWTTLDQLAAGEHEHEI